MLHILVIINKHIFLSIEIYSSQKSLTTQYLDLVKKNLVYPNSVSIIGFVYKNICFTKHAWVQIVINIKNNV